MKSFCLYARWLWTASKETRASLFLYSLLQLLYTGVSFYFIYVCKTLVDIASGVSTLDFQRYIWQLAGCVVFQLILSNGKSYLSVRNNGCRTICAAGCFPVLPAWIMKAACVTIRATYKAV